MRKAPIPDRAQPASATISIKSSSDCQLVLIVGKRRQVQNTKWFKVAAEQARHQLVAIVNIDRQLVGGNQKYVRRCGWLGPVKRVEIHSECQKLSKLQRQEYK